MLAEAVLFPLHKNCTMATRALLSSLLCAEESRALLCSRILLARLDSTALPESGSGWAAWAWLVSAKQGCARKEGM